MTRITVILATVFSLAFTPLAAQDLQKGTAAILAGDWAEGARWYRLAAEQGYAKAQTNLGYMYANGQGVLQDNVTASMWYTIGAVNGNELGGTNRDIIAEGMTSSDIFTAQKMARDCMSSNYQNCGY